MGKLKTHSLWLYIVIHITDGGIVKLHKLDGTPVKGLVNGSRLKPYQDSHDLVENKKQKTKLSKWFFLFDCKLPICRKRKQKVSQTIYLSKMKKGCKYNLSITIKEICRTLNQVTGKEELSQDELDSHKWQLVVINSKMWAILTAYFLVTSFIIIQ